ncbi:hypothetical protein Hanom_Chr10g00929921 [Helianthus anomalus]
MCYDNMLYGRSLIVTHRHNLNSTQQSLFTLLTPYSYSSLSLFMSLIFSH